MNEFKRNIFRISVEDEVPPVTGYCVNWSAANEGNIRMSLSGYIDFTEILAGRFIQGGGASAGTVTSYIINGVSTPCSINMTFATKRANFNTNALPVVSNKVLTSITLSAEIICTDASELPPLSNITLGAEEMPDQFNSSYNSCT